MSFGTAFLIIGIITTSRDYSEIFKSVGKTRVLRDCNRWYINDTALILVRFDKT